MVVGSESMFAHDRVIARYSLRPAWAAAQWSDCSERLDQGRHTDAPSGHPQKKVMIEAANRAFAQAHYPLAL
jgi:hypothetical protein